MIYQALAKVFLICSSSINLRDRDMDRMQATEIARHLHDAAEAIDRASAVISALDQADRTALANPLGETVSALHFSAFCGLFTIAIRTCDRHRTKSPPSIRPCNGR